MRGQTLLVWCEETRVLGDGTRITVIAAMLIEHAPRPITARQELEAIDVAPVRESAPLSVLRRAA